jgi:S-formylglutathione hydrolase FrmB
MIRFLFLCLLIVSCTHHKPARFPSSLKLIEIDSKIGDIPYWIIKPEGEFFVPLPVVYFLHGRGGNRFMFRDIGGVNALKDHLEKGGSPFVVVGLSGTFEGKDTYWVNETRDNILNKMIPEIEKLHSIGGANNRMMAGISMGSHGAFQMALTTKLFKCVAGHSLVLRDYNSMNAQFPGMFGTKRQFAKRDPVQLIKKYKSKKRLPFAKAWVDIGGKDSPEFISRAKIMQDELTRLGFDQSYLDVAQGHPNGAHDFPYWTSRIQDYVEWYGQCFL